MYQDKHSQINSTLDVNRQQMSNVQKEIGKRDTQIEELALNNIELEGRIQEIEHQRDQLLAELGQQESIQTQNDLLRTLEGMVLGNSTINT